MFIYNWQTVTACETALKRRERERDVEPACRVPLITSAREEQMLISTSAKPVVKLLINRHNNKYSYTRYLNSFRAPIRRVLNI